MRPLYRLSGLIVIALLIPPASACGGEETQEIQSAETQAWINGERHDASACALDDTDCLVPNVACAQVISTWLVTLRVVDAAPGDVLALAVEGSFIEPEVPPLGAGVVNGIGETSVSVITSNACPPAAQVSGVVVEDTATYSLAFA